MWGLTVWAVIFVGLVVVWITKSKRVNELECQLSEEKFHKKKLRNRLTSTPALYTLGEVEDKHGVPAKVIREAILAGKLKGKRVGRTYIVTDYNVEQYMLADAGFENGFIAKYKAKVL